MKGSRMYLSEVNVTYICIYVLVITGQMITIVAKV